MDSNDYTDEQIAKRLGMMSPYPVCPWCGATIQFVVDGNCPECYKRVDVDEAESRDAPMNLWRNMSRLRGELRWRGLPWQMFGDASEDGEAGIVTFRLFKDADECDGIGGQWIEHQATSEDVATIYTVREAYRRGWIPEPSN